MRTRCRALQLVLAGQIAIEDPPWPDRHHRPRWNSFGTISTVQSPKNATPTYAANSVKLPASRPCAPSLGGRRSSRRRTVVKPAAARRMPTARQEERWISTTPNWRSPECDPRHPDVPCIGHASVARRVGDRQGASFVIRRIIGLVEPKAAGGPLSARASRRRPKSLFPTTVSFATWTA